MILVFVLESKLRSKLNTHIDVIHISLSLRISKECQHDFRRYKRLANKMQLPTPPQKRKEFLSKYLLTTGYVTNFEVPILSINVKSGTRRGSSFCKTHWGNNPGQLTNLDCVISYAFGCLFHPPDNQKWTVVSIISAHKIDLSNNT